MILAVGLSFMIHAAIVRLRSVSMLPARGGGDLPNRRKLRGHHATAGRPAL